MKELIKAAAKSGTGTLITLLSAAVAIKIVAWMSGPSGVGLFSLLRQTQQTASIAGAIGGQTAVVQCLSSKQGGEKNTYFVVIVRSVLVATAATCCLILIGAPYIAPLLIGAVPENVVLLRLMSVPTLLGSGVMLLSGVINSQRAIGALAIVQIASGLALALFAYPMSRQSTGIGFVLLLIISSLAGGSVALVFCLKNKWFVPIVCLFRQRTEAAQFRQFLEIGGTTLATGLMGTASVLVVRAMVSNVAGLSGAGIFDAAWTLSMTYVMLILSSFSTYYLPVLAGTRGVREKQNALMEQVFRFAIYGSILLISGVIIIKPWIIKLLYTKEFLPAVHMMTWMLLGDYLKISSWVMAMPMIAFADIKTFFLSEFLWNVAFVTLSYVVLITMREPEYLGGVFFLLYLIYFLFTVYYSKSKYKLKLPGKTIVHFILGFSWLVVLTIGLKFID